MSSKNNTPKYQLLPPLSPEERAALRADIEKRGVLIPVEKDEDGNTLDGHNREDIAKELRIECPVIERRFATEEEKREHIIKVNLVRRHMDPIRWGQTFTLLLEERGVRTGKGGDRKSTDTVSVDTVSEIAAELGVNERTARRRVRAANDYESLPAKVRKKVDAGEITLREGKAEVKKAKKNAAREAAAAEGAIVSLPDGYEVHCGDFREKMASIPDASVSLIFCDPPYDEESIPLYGDLAVQAARVLKVGGSLIVYAGHYAIPEIVSLMAMHLRYWWILALRHAGNSARLPGKWVLVEWKPLLWYVKENRWNEEYIADLVESELPDKEMHDWQQAEKEATYLIEKLTLPGELVLDPMCGSGTTLTAARRLGRQAIGIELDPVRANVAKKAVHDAVG
jgi:ParB-like chromosome segregation protein Spo0J